MVPGEVEVNRVNCIHRLVERFLLHVHLFRQFFLTPHALGKLYSRPGWLGHGWSGRADFFSVKEKLPCHWKKVTCSKNARVIWVIFTKSPSLGSSRKLQWPENAHVEFKSGFRKM